MAPRTIIASRLRVVAAASCLVFLAGAMNGVVNGPSPLGGDDLEYYLCLFTLGQHANFVINDSVIQEFLAEFPGVTRKDVQAGLVPFRDGMYDTLHFWGLSALAAPFCPLLKALGLSWKLSFAVLNALLLSLAVFAAGAIRGLRAMALVAVGVLVSPLIPYLAKAHAEVFVVSLEIVALFLLLDRRYLAAAGAVCLLSVQVSAFSPFAVVSLMLWAWNARSQGFRLTRQIFCFGCVLGLALQPVWNLLRHGTLNLIVARGFVWPDMATPKRMLAMFVDPDVGLLFNWPAALAVLAAFIIAARIDRRVPRQSTAFWIGTALFFLAMPYVQAQQANFTTSAVRYAYWYIPFFLVLATLAGGISFVPKAGPVVVHVLILAGFAATGYYNLVVRDVQVLRLERSPLAEVFYREFPSLYNPDKQVFVDISLKKQLVNGRQIFTEERTSIPGLTDEGMWAVSNSACNKLLVFVSAFQTGYTEYKRPAGCQEPLDPLALLHRLEQSGLLPSKDGYVNLPAKSVHLLAPVLKVGQALDFGDRRTENYLGRGWSQYEAWGRWSSGERSELRFRVGPETAHRRREALKLALSYVVFAQHVPVQRIRCYVNRELVATIEKRGSLGVLQMEVPLPSEWVDTIDMVFQIEHPVPSRWSGILWRPLGFGLVKMVLLPGSPGDKLNGPPTFDGG